MQNSAHYGTNGVSNLVREGKKFRCFFASNLMRIYGKKGKFSAHCRRETEKKYECVFGKDTSLFSIFFIIFDYNNIQIF